MIRALKCAFINTDDAELKKYFTDGLIAECKLQVRNVPKDKVEFLLKDLKVVQSKVKVEDAITADVRIAGADGNFDMMLRLKFEETGWKALYIYASGKELDENKARVAQEKALEVIAGGEKEIKEGK